jgi:transposase
MQNIDLIHSKTTDITEYNDDDIFSKVAELEAKKSELEDENEKLSIEVELLQAKIKWYEEQIRLSAQKKFGASSEKIDVNQMSIFNEAEKDANTSNPDPSIETIIYDRKKKVGRNKEIYKDLPVETIEYRLEGDDLLCDRCGNERHVMKTIIRKEIQVVPMQLKVVEHIQNVYSCRHCEKNSADSEATVPIVKAPMPSPVLPGSFVSPSLMAHVMIRKYSEGVPLYRQETQFRNSGINISRINLANWVIRGADDWLSVLYSRMHELLVKEEVLFADETTVQVLKEVGKTPQSTSYMWLYRTGDRDRQIILYDYKPNRQGKNPKAFLKGFKGYLHVDGYSGYNSVDNAVLVGCWAHVRRKFYDATIAINDTSSILYKRAEKGLEYCTQLFKKEEPIKHDSIEERFEERIKISKPIVDEFHQWLIQQKSQALPKSMLGEAINYTLNQWGKLENYLLDGRLEISNNISERSIKPFVISRKNFLFSNSTRGATASAVVFSILETAKGNNLNPFPYLTYVLGRLPNINIKNQAEVDSLLPWSPDLPEDCRLPVNK